MRFPDRYDRQVGTISVRLDGVLLAEVPIVLPAQEEARPLRRLWDGVLMFLARLFGGRPVVDSADLPVAELTTAR